MSLQIVSQFVPSGDQPQAIIDIVSGLNCGVSDQVLLGVTGSGKTFTMANIIAKTQRPALIIAHNKTLAAQLYEEMRAFFPNNAVEYFVSYYDYYQPEAYIPQTDTYIEKDSAINEKIDLLRHSATRSLMERQDVVVVASVSCIYGLGSPELYLQMTLSIAKGDKIKMKTLQSKLVELQYEYASNSFTRGTFRVSGDTLDIFPSHYENRAWRLSFFGDDIDSIAEFDPLTNHNVQKLEKIIVFAKSHYVTPRPTLLQAIDLIKSELAERLEFYRQQNKIVEAQRLEQRTMFDIEMLRETSHCKGIENYSRYLSGKLPGQPPPTLFEYMPKNSLLFVDESHVTVPQISAMYNGDRARKSNLVNYGFRLPSALDNRPLKFEEWEQMRPTTVYVSATPGKYELSLTKGVFTEQIIRPTGLLDPVCTIKPATNQVDDVIAESIATTKKGYRTLITALTKKMAENLSEYIKELGLKVTYLHSDVHTLERIEIIYNLRRGDIDILVGVNLLREGLDIPECGLVAILDADKEGFLRSTTSLIQTIGRAARNSEGRVILYADKMTDSITKTLEETNRRRTKQQEYNLIHGIVPMTIDKPILNSLSERVMGPMASDPPLSEKTIHDLTQEMLQCAENLDFEKAARIRNQIEKLQKSNARR